MPLHGPSFGTFAAEDVVWLLSDLSSVLVERPAEEREVAIQAGREHYSDSLAPEYRPTSEYLEIFGSILEAQAFATAVNLGVLAERILAERGRDVVLVSLARAGTVFGVLIRRWLRAFHDIDAPHYSLSIIRGRGIDEIAMDHLLRRYEPRHIVFVDGWTGKGAITAELHDTFRRRPVPGLVTEPAVVADPGSTTSMFGTRDDLLVASACLNCTVSGLVSRTVLRPDLTGPGSFHGAKFYADRQAEDQTHRFLDSVESQFVAARPLAEAAHQRITAERPTWVGRKHTEMIATRYQVDDLHLVKPGLGEATRVLLRRAAWLLILRDPAAAHVQHLVQLARERGARIEVDPQSPFEAVGIIRANRGGST